MIFHNRLHAHGRGLATEKNRNEDKKVSHAISSRLKSQILIFEEGYSEVFRKRACMFIIFKPFLSPCTLF